MSPFDPRLVLIANIAHVRPPHVFHVWHAILEQGEAFDAESFALFCQLEQKHIAAIFDALTDRQFINAKAPRQASSKGTRIEQGFEMPEEWKLWARRKRFWSEADVSEEAEQFADFWKAKAGPNGVKLDWRATWQTWVRNSRRANGERSPDAQAPQPEDRAAYHDRTAALYERTGRSAEAEEERRKAKDLRANVLEFRSATG